MPIPFHTIPLALKVSIIKKMGLHENVKFQITSVEANVLEKKYCRNRITVTDMFKCDDLKGNYKIIYMKQDEHGQPIMEFGDFTVDFGTIENQKMRFDAFHISIIGDFDDTYCSAAISLMNATESTCLAITFEPTMSRIMCSPEKMDEFLETFDPIILNIPYEETCPSHEFQKYLKVPAFDKAISIYYGNIIVNETEEVKVARTSCQNSWSDVKEVKETDTRSEDSWSVVSLEC